RASARAIDRHRRWSRTWTAWVACNGERGLVSGNPHPGIFFDLATLEIPVVWARAFALPRQPGKTGRSDDDFSDVGDEVVRSRRRETFDLVVDPRIAPDQVSAGLRTAARLLFIT